MQCHITSARGMSAETFRVLHALKIVSQKFNKKGSARPNDEVIIDEVVDHLDRVRPGIQPAYTRKIVEEALTKGVLYGLVRERDLQLTGCGNDLIELTLESEDPLLERHRQWYSPEKRASHEASAGMAVAA